MGARACAAGEGYGLTPVAVVDNGCYLGKGVCVPGNEIRGTVELHIGEGCGTGTAREAQGDYAITLSYCPGGGVGVAWFSIEVKLGQVIEPVIIRVGLRSGDQGVVQFGWSKVEDGPVTIAS